MEGAGFEVDTVSDGATAIARFFEILPDIAILDILMPEVDGYEACAAIRRSKKGQSTPIIMITGLDDSESVNKAYKVGATNFITKPINWELFEHEVWYIWRAAQALKDVEFYSKRVKELESTLNKVHGTPEMSASSIVRNNEDVLDKIKSISSLGEFLIQNFDNHDKEKMKNKINTMLVLSNDISDILKA